MAATQAKLMFRLLGPVLLGVLLWRMPNPGAIWAPLKSAHWGWLAATVLFNFANVHLKALRWSGLVASTGAHYPLGRAWTACLSSSYVSMLTPGRVGDLLRLQYLKSDVGTPFPAGLALLLLDRLTDLYVLTGMLGIAVWRWQAFLPESLVRLLIGTFFLALLSPLLWWLAPNLAEALVRRIYQRMGKDLSGSGALLFLQTLRDNLRGRLAIGIALAAGAVTVNYVQGWCIAQALGFNIHPIDAACLVAVATFLALVPVSVSGLGVREALFATMFPVLGLSAAEGVTYGLTLFSVAYLALVAVGFASWQLAPPPILAPPILAAPPAPQPPGNTP